MKNIHILPTDKPSRLFIDIDDNKLKLTIPIGGEHMMNQNIYITSDEEIKEGDWFYNTISLKPELFKACENGDGYVNCSKYSHYRIDCKKIILTTDQELIKDGVQAIDDDFLEWFVKNPSCQEVETYSLGIQNVETGESGHYKYEIIIPKEEPKQVKCNDKFNQILLEGDYVDVQKDGVQLIYKKEDNQLYFKPYGKEDKVSTYFSNDLIKCDKVGNWITNDRYEDIIDEIKKETLEEVAKDFIENTMRYLFNSTETKTTANRMLKCAEFGAKWQQERMYGVIDEYVNDVMGGCNLRFEEWFEQFKNK